MRTNRPTPIANAIVEIGFKDDKVDTILKTIKGDVLKEFEKVCPTDTSFQRIKKDMHDIFDEARRQLQG
jgi:hypothetical protein